MIVNDLDLERVAIRPREADPPSIVDSNAVLAYPVPRQGLQTVPWRGGQVAQFDSRIKHPELSTSDRLYRVELLTTSSGI